MRLGRKRLIMRRWRVTSNQLLPLAYILLNSLSCHWINLSCSAVHEVVHEVGQVNHYNSHQRQPAAVGQTLPGDTNQIDQATHLRHTGQDHSMAKKGRSEKGKFLQASSIMVCSNFNAFSANKSFNGDAIALFKRMYFISNLVTPKVEQVKKNKDTTGSLQKLLSFRYQKTKPNDQ